MCDIKIWEEKEHCNCNSCGAINYKSSLLPEMFEKADRLITIQVGTPTITLCPQCALELVKMLEQKNNKED